MAKELPEEMHAAYDWTDAAGELDELATLKGEALDAYAKASAANAREHDVHDVHEGDIVALAEWLARPDLVWGQAKVKEYK